MFEAISVVDVALASVGGGISKVGSRKFKSRGSEMFDTGGAGEGCSADADDDETGTVDDGFVKVSPQSSSSSSSITY